MKRLILIFICFITLFSAGQTLHTDNRGVRIFYEIKQTEKFIFCQGDTESDKNFSAKKINIWEVTLGLKNGYSRSIVPRSVGIANINVQRNPIKPYPGNYCRYKRLENYGPNTGYFDQSLFAWPIRDHMVEEIKPGEVLTNTAFLYLYEGQTPVLTNSQFLGYQLKKNFKPKDPVLPKIKDVEKEPEAATPLDTERKEKAKTMEAKHVDKVDSLEIPAVKIDEINFNTTEEVASGSNAVEEKETTSDDDEEKTDRVDSLEIPAAKVGEISFNTAEIAASESGAIEEIETANNDDDNTEEVIVKCPGAKALEYKEKSNTSSDSAAQKAYGWLALYYTYICECEEGSPRSDQLVAIISNVVDSYFMNTSNAYGKISKVSKCKAPIRN